MNPHAKKVESVDKSQHNNKSNKTLPCTNSSEQAGDVLYSKTAVQPEKNDDKNYCESKINNKYKFNCTGKTNNDNDDDGKYENGNYDNNTDDYDNDDDEEEQMDANHFQKPHAKNKKNVTSSSSSSSLPFDLHGAERLRR